MENLKSAPDSQSTSQQNTSQAEELLQGGKVMPLFEHLSELRTRLVRSLVGVLVIFLLCFGFAEHIINFLTTPLESALPPEVNKLHFTGPLDVFIINIKVGVLCGIILGCPIWLFQFWKFFEPALYPRERKYILPFTFASVALFFAGVAFSFLLILPMALEFLIGMGMQVGEPIITIKDYFSLLTILIFGFGIIFETPLILVLLAFLDLVSAKDLQNYRKFVLVGIMVVGALMTPPDPISQIAMAVPVYIMYEIAILIIRTLEKKEEQEKVEQENKK